MLLEHAPCQACRAPFRGQAAASVICDRCNAAYHLKCVHLKSVPRTYWYCQACSAHIKARGIRCPTEDLLLQQFLQGQKAPPELHDAFTKQAERLSFAGGQLLTWQHDRWLHYAPVGH